MAPFFISKNVIDPVQSDRIGEFGITRTDPEHRYQLTKTASKFEGTSRSFGAVAQLQASLAYLEKVGVARIENHTVALARHLNEGLVKQGHRLFTPPENRSSIVTFYCAKPTDDVRAMFRTANVDVTVRGGQVRVSPALFNNMDEIERCLGVSKRLL